jgi:cellobiose phosphorylase
MTKMEVSDWEFIDETGAFRLRNPQFHSSLYFPLVNAAGLFSSVTPNFHGDIKADNNAYLTLPVSVASLHDSRSARNFWIKEDDKAPWSATGNSAAQVVLRATDKGDEVVLEAGFLWQRVTRKNGENSLQAEVTSFVPSSSDRVELMKVSITNLSGLTISISSTVAIPIYGRSADNLRDHRHVTSLLNRTRCGKFGVLVNPTLSFDERGHQLNMLTYAVLGVDCDGNPPIGFFPVVEDFIGEGGSLDWPESIVQTREPNFRSGMSVDGYESIGGLRFAALSLPPGERRSYIIMLTIMNTDESELLVSKYGSEANFDCWLNKTKDYWQTELDVPRFFTGNARFGSWMHWVKAQPLIRKLFGNSFLPYHDYGRGGRGWRDLWQDALALLIVEGGGVKQMILDNFGGVRIDGSNVTIVGSQPGEFKADRNNIPRVWMDHGAWPLLTTGQYIDQTGDLMILLQNQTYFKDHLEARAQGMDSSWTLDKGTILLTSAGTPYEGTVLEHMIVQHLVPFFNVGEHNNIRLEGADWNDAMDMASQRGESVAFTALYAGNIRRLSEWVLELIKSGFTEVEIATEVLTLLDTLADPVDYNSVIAKRNHLANYYANCNQCLSGSKISIGLTDLAADLSVKANWLVNHLRNHEWLTNSEGYSWFNGYYDNNGLRVEGDFPNGVRMTLTGQVFALMGEVASDEQVNEIVRSVEKYLYDPGLGGYRLNTDFGEVYTTLGRGFGFAYGHKENGAMFSHMAVMYANALYHRGKVKEGYKVLDSIYQHCQDFSRSHIFPGIPEYINERGRGMYTYLTGSASWYVLTLVTESFGIRGRLGDLVLEPKLVSEQFGDGGEARLITRFAERRLEIVYINQFCSDFEKYRVQSIKMDGQPFEFSSYPVIIPRTKISSLDPNKTHRIEIQLK